MLDELADDFERAGQELVIAHDLGQVGDLLGSPSGDQPAGLPDDRRSDRGDCNDGVSDHRSPTATPAPSIKAVVRDRAVATFLVAQATSTIAVTLQAAALAKHVYDITDSEFALGLLGLVEFMPALLLLPFTGSVADRFDRRRVAAIAFTLEIGVSLLLCLYATTDPTSARADSSGWRPCSGRCGRSECRRCGRSHRSSPLTERCPA